MPSAGVRADAHRHWPILRAPLCLSIAVSLTLVGASAPDVSGDGPRPAPLPRQTVLGGWADRLQRWRNAVDTHQPGNADASAIDISAWPGPELQDVVTDLVTLRTLLVAARYQPKEHPSKPPLIEYQGYSLDLSAVARMLGMTDREAAQGNINRLLARAALLHTDILVLDSQKLRQPARVYGRTVVVTVDGVDQGYGGASVHLEIARRLLAEMRPPESSAGFIRAWHHLAAVYLLRKRMLAEADTHLRRGRQMFGRDGDILFDTGCLNEMYAAPLVQSVVQADRSKYAVESPKTHWQRAESYFRQALNVAPRNPDVLVHLARVTGLLGHHDEAARGLRRAMTDAADPLLLYCADMFLGDEEQALGRRDAARKCYERAAARYPGAQAPHLALGQLARRSGDRLAALEAIDRVFAIAAAPHPYDPWFEYPALSLQRAADLAAAWRASVLEQERR